jgi:ferredoxin
MFKFTTGKNVKIDPSDNLDKKTVIFGIRPCDAKSYNILDPVFKNDFEDPYYINKRKNSVLIGLSCNKPGVNCFCTSFNDSPASAEHVDILFTDINDKYYVDVNSDKGKQLIKNMSEFFTNPSEKDKQKRKEVEKKAIDDITRQINIDKIEDKLDNIVDSEYWKKIARRCSGCGICTYLCPTCHCFDIQDEVSATKGARVRVWDTCMRSEYTLHASGFNPRPMRMNRVRNRIYHKYNYFPKNFGMIACVGCGRCTENCPVNIDIIDVINKSREVVCP